MSAVKISKVGVYTSTNGHKQEVFVDHMTSDKRCLGGYKLKVRPHGRGVPVRGCTWKYVPIGRVELLG